MELGDHLNEVWAAEAIKQATKAIRLAKVHPATTASTPSNRHTKKVY